jgi:hypothetical protein
MMALRIDPDGTTELINIGDRNLLPALQGAVGGYIEGVIKTDGIIIYANEEGLLQQLPPNRAASALVLSICEIDGLHVPLGAGGLVGSAVVVGNDGTEDACELSMAWVDRLTLLGLWPT